MRRLLFLSAAALAIAAAACTTIPTDYTARLKVECFTPDSGGFIVIATGDTLRCYTSKTP
jgi:hypothetical protein